jgi:hypothetical protein
MKIVKKPKNLFPSLPKKKQISWLEPEDYYNTKTPVEALENTITGALIL